MLTAKGFERERKRLRFVEGLKGKEDNTERKREEEGKSP